MAKRVIDSLVVTLGLDNFLFKKGMKESDKIQDEHEVKLKKIDKQHRDSEIKANREQQKFHKEQMHRNREVLDGFTRLRNETLALLTIFTAGKGFIDFAADTFAVGTAMGHLSDNTGMSVSEIAGWRLAMQAAGGSAEGASSAIDKAAIAVADFKVGVQNSAVQGLFTAAGGTGVNLEGAFKSTKSFLLAQADVVGALYKRNPEEAMAKARQFMGIDPETFNLLKQGRAELLKTLAVEERQAGWNARQAEAAQRALRDWTNIQAQLSTVGRTILFALNPAITSAIKALSSWVSKKDNIKKITDAWNDFVKSVKGIDWKIIAADFDTAFSGILETLKLAGILAGLVVKTGEIAGTGVGMVRSGTDETAGSWVSKLDNFMSHVGLGRDYAHQGFGGQSNTVTIGTQVIHLPVGVDGKQFATDFNKWLKTESAVQSNSAQN